MTFDTCGSGVRRDLTVNLPCQVTSRARCATKTVKLITNEVVNVGPIGNCNPECVDTVDGRYTLHGLAPGPTALVTGETPTYWRPATPTPVTVVSGQSVEADPLLLLRRHFATIAGTVRDQLTGDGIEGAEVHDGFYGAPRDETDNNGRFTLTPVPLNFRNSDRTVTVEVRAEGYWDKFVDVPVTDGQPTPDQDIQLLRICTGATITGTVLNVAPPIPVPIAEATVSGGGHVATTDAQGHYTLGPLQVGTNNTEIGIEVTAAKEGFITQFQTVKIDCGAQINLDFGHPAPATLSVHKHTVGGTGTFGFTSTGGLPTVAGPDGGFTLTTTATANPGERIFPELTPGSVYTLTEQAAPGWALTGLACESAGASRIRYGPSSTVLHDTWQPGDTTAQVTFASGDSVTCGFTNTAAVDIPQLKLVKSVTNNDGGTRVADEWSLSATAAAPNDGRNFNNAGGSGSFQNVFAGAAYTLAEDPNPGNGYSSTGQWSCPGGTMSAGNTVVTVPLGAQVTCTIVNTDNTPQLKLVKNVSGGSATPNSFTVAAAAPVPNNGRNFSNLGGSGAFQNVFANATHTLSETGPAGYTASAWNCDGGTQVGATIQVPLGASVTCTITNTRDVGTITAIKYHDLNADGSSVGDPGLSGWTLFVDKDKTGTLTPGDVSGTTDANGSVSFPGIETTVNGASYWVCEVLQADWVNSDPGASSVSANGRCKAVTVAKDATTTVRLGNFQRIKIQVNKTLDQLRVPAGKTFQFSIRKDASTNPADANGGFGTVVASGLVTGPDSTITSTEWAVVAGRQYPLNPGTYQLCESIVDGFTPSWIQGVYGVDWFSPGIQAAGGFQETENTLACRSVNVVSGDGGADNTVELNVENVTRGFSHTIGFWKNWTSCDGGGNQFAMLDLMISGGTRHGITYVGADDSNGNGLRDIRIGNLYIEGANACKMAVDLLDKRPVGDPAKAGDKSKAAGDPVYNSVAQLVAFELNRLLNATGTGSAACQAKATSAAELMQRFLTYIDFRRTASNSLYTMPSNKTRVKEIETDLVYLANVIDDYNNSTIGGCAAALALPYQTVAGTSPAQTWAAFLGAYSDT